MSLALYRKYRPATFAELKGQEHVAEPLQQALRNGRVHHAYLFSGPRGCGKTSSARILARSLNCEEGPTPEPCGKCELCVALGPAGPGHVDVIEIDAASHGGVDDARDLRERAFFAPVTARFKIYIIDEAHMVTREGFNALLKLVEEPPPHLKFVFATTEPEKVIGTIRSRTHHYPFRLIPPGTLRELLEEILEKEKVPYDPAALPLVVRAGAGSARDSESILDQLLAGAGDEGITYERAMSLLGYTDSSLLGDVVDAFAAGDGAGVFAAIDRVIESGQDPRRFAADLLGRFRDLVILSNVPDVGSSGLLDVPSDELERIKGQASRMGAADLARAADLLHTGLTEMRGATSPRLLLELICARILLPGAHEDEMSMLTRLERLERRLALGGTPSAEPPPTQQAPSVPVQRSVPPVAEQPPAPSPAPETDGPPAGRQAGEARKSGQDQGQPPQTGKSSEARGQRDPEAVAPVSPSRPDPGTSAQSSRPAAPSAPAAPSSPGGLDVAAVRRSWPEILETVKRKRRVAWMILMQDVQVAALEGHTLTLAFKRSGDVKGFSSSGSDAILKQVLTEMLGVTWRVEAIVGGPGDSGGSGGHGGGTAPPSAPAPPAADPNPGPEAAAPGEPSAGQAATPAAPAREPAPEQSGGAGPAGDGPVADEADDVDPEGDADADAGGHDGMELIQRELGGEIIKEIEN